jgi:hypothetical protein
MTNDKKNDFSPINEKYTIRVDMDDVNDKFTLKEKINIIFYKLDKNILVDPEKITITSKKIFKGTVRESLKTFLENKIAPVTIYDYLQIFQDDVDHYGLLKINDHNKIFEKIVNTLITGIPMYKNF